MKSDTLGKLKARFSLLLALCLCGTDLRPINSFAADSSYQFTSSCNRGFLSDKEFWDSTGFSVIDLTKTGENSATEDQKVAEKQFFVVNRDILEQSDVRERLAKSPSKLVIASSGSQNDIVNYLTSSFDRTRILLVAPLDSEGVTRMYGNDLTRTETEGIKTHFKRAKDALNGLTNLVLLDSSSSKPLREALLSKIHEAKEGELFIIIAHNDDGVLKFPDGSSLSIGDLAQRAKTENKQAMVISCDTINHLPKEITGIASVGLLDPEVVAESVRRAETTIRGLQGIIMGDYLNALQSGFESAGDPALKRAKVIVAIGGGFVVSVAIPVILYEANQQKDKR